MRLLSLFLLSLSLTAQIAPVKDPVTNNNFQWLKQNTVQKDGKGNVTISATVLNGATGTESSPVTSADGTAGIQAQIDAFAAGRGGLLQLTASRYDVTATNGIQITTPGITLAGVGAGMNQDPNGTQEGVSGTKIRATKLGLKLGNASSRINVTVRDLYIWCLPAQSCEGVTLAQPMDQPILSNVRVGDAHRAIHIAANTDAVHISRPIILGNNWGIYSDGIFGYMKIDGGEISDNQYDGFYGAPSSYSYGARITNTSFIRNCLGDTANCAAVDWGGYRGIVANNVFRSTGNGAHLGVGVRLTGLYNIVANNNFDDHQRGYAIDVTGDNNTIGPNVFQNNPVGDILVEAGADNNVVYASPGTKIRDLGTSTAIIAPLGYAAIMSDVSASPWSQFAATATAGQADPFGGTDAAALVANNGVNSGHSAYVPVAPTTAQTPVGFSFYAKAGSQSWVAMALKIGGVDKLAYANLGTCAAGTVDAAYASFVVSQPVTGWCLLRGTAASAPTVVAVQMATANGTSSFTGDGLTGVTVYHPMFQYGPSLIWQ